MTATQSPDAGRARPDPYGPLPLAVRLLGRPRRGVPDPPFAARRERDLPIDLPDGTRLLADHYAPAADGPFPTLVVRTPYGRNFPWNLFLGAGLARRGFHVALVSTRGTHGSGGRWRLFRDDVDDALPVVDWLRSRPWYDGRFATIGPSYLGFTQLALAAAAPPEGLPDWRAAVLLAPVAAPARAQTTGGVLALESTLVTGLARVQALGSFPRFLAATAGVTRRLRGVRRLPVLAAGRAVLGRTSDVFEDFATHPDPRDPFWDGTDLRAAATRLPATLVVAGWWDLLLEQTLDVHARRRDAGVPTSLLAGPWTHTSMVGPGWPDVLDAALPFLAAAFEGRAPEPVVRVHVGGGPGWRDLTAWPPPATDVAWRLGAGGTLFPAAEAAGDAAAGPPSTIRYDPTDPTPSLGGATLGRSGGSVDDAAVTGRPDVLSFTSAPLTQHLEVIGTPSVRLLLRVAGGGADAFVRLCDVGPDGACRNVTDGIVRLDPQPAVFGPDGGLVTVPLDATAHRFAAGHRLRVHVSGGAFPRFARNPGTGEPVATAGTVRAATIEVLHDAARPGEVVLPQPG